MPDFAAIATSRRMACAASEESRAALARIGRTEDARFSPDGGRLALAGLAKHRLLVVEVEADPGRPAVALGRCVEIESGALRHPHGLFWLDGQALAVANRSGGAVLFRLPEGALDAARLELRPVRELGEADFVNTPGSISAQATGLDLVELLVCNNYAHCVTRHLLDARRGYTVVTSQVLLDDGLAVPDGVAHSPCGGWIAVSNHDRRAVFLYRNDAALGPRSRPDGTLAGISFPHGLCFAAAGRNLLVADAGTPMLHVFASEDGDWSGERRPAASLAVVDEQAFRRGAYNPQEGGPKGIDLAPGGALLVTSCEEQPLAFFDLGGLIEPAPAAAPPDAEVARAALLRHLGSAQANVAASAAAVRRPLEQELRLLKDSRSWRVTAPLRRLAASWRGDRR